MDIIKVNIIDLDGNKHQLEAPTGYRLMEAIRDNDLPIKAECNGCCACATCHVYVDEKWFDKLVPATPEETKMMDDAFFVEKNSRLSCQIILKPEFDGLEASIAPGNFD